MEPRTEPGRQPLWVRWAVGLGLVFLGAAVGAISLHVVLLPILGGTDTFTLASSQAKGQVRAFVSDAPLPIRARPGERLVTTWVVINVGQAVWPVDQYRFVPATADLGLVSLPRTVHPGQGVTMRMAIEPPEFQGRWSARWQLTGPDGPVEGGLLEILVFAVIE